MLKKIMSKWGLMLFLLLVFCFSSALWYASMKYRQYDDYANADVDRVSMAAGKAVMALRFSLGSFLIGFSDPDAPGAATPESLDVTISDAYLTAAQEMRAKSPRADAISAGLMNMLEPALVASGPNEILPFGLRHSQIENAEDLAYIAMLDGILEIGAERILIDPRLDERIDEILSEQTGVLAQELVAIRQIGIALGAPFLEGNDRLWATIAYHLREAPRLNKRNFSLSKHPNRSKTKTWATPWVPEIRVDEYPWSVLIRPDIAK